MTCLIIRYVTLVAQKHKLVELLKWDERKNAQAKMTVIFSMRQNGAGIEI